MTTMSNSSSNNNIAGQFGDTTLTKVFVGGLAWETQKEAMREHFEKYGDILEAVIISDKLTGRSKGYGFVTFKEAEAAKKACEDATPVINGRRANCNLASLGARRPRSASVPPPTSTTPPPPPPTQQVSSNVVVGPRSNSPANRVQWYYPAAAAAPASHYQHHHAIPYHPYGYSPTYITAADMYNPQKVGYTGGSYMNGHFSQVYPGGHGMVSANTMMPVYPFYHYHHHHQSQTMGVPAAAHIYPQTATGPLTTVPAAIISKPPSMAPNTAVCLTVE